MKKITSIILIGAMVVTAGCTSIGVPSSQYQVQAQTNGEVGSLKGEATAHYLLFGILGWGDAGIATAAKDSGGKYIRTVDRSANSFLGLFGSVTTKVTTENTPSAPVIIEVAAPTPAPVADETVTP